MRALAVDFGTSNTVAAIGVDGGAPRLVAIDGSPLLPSSVFRTDDGALAVGRDADRQARLDPTRYEPNPKRRIDDGEILLGDAAVPVVSAIAAVLRRVAGEVGRQLGGPPDQVRLTHPARWGSRRRDTLLAASREAGLADDPVLIPEPVAAATHFATLSGTGLADGAALAVYDLGGGTFDAAVVRRRGAGYEVLAEAGLPDLGGVDFDQAILDHIGRTQLAGPDREDWQRLLAPSDPASRRAARTMATDIRDGKEALSRHPHVDIALPPPFADVHLTRSELDELIRSDLQRSVDLVGRAIADAGLSPDRLAGVYLVGGSSRVPLVARLIQEGLGVTPTTLDQPETSVATGALYLPVGAKPAAQGPVAGPSGRGAPGSGPRTGPGATAAAAGLAAGAATGPGGPGRTGPVPGVPAAAGPVAGAPRAGMPPTGPGAPRPAGPTSGAHRAATGPQTLGPASGAHRAPTGPGTQPGSGAPRPGGSQPTGPTTGSHRPAATGPGGPRPAGPATGAQRSAGPVAGAPRPAGIQSTGPVPGVHRSGPPSGTQPAGPVSGTHRSATGPRPAAAGQPARGPVAGSPQLGRPAPARPGIAQAGPARPAAAPAPIPRPAPNPAFTPAPGGPPPAAPTFRTFTGGPGGPPGPGTGKRSRGTLYAISGGLAAVLVLVVTLIAVNLGNSGDPGPTPTPTIAGPTTSSGGSTASPSTEFDRFFTSTALRDYVRPFYGEIESCTEEDTSGTSAAQCVFDDGHEVLLFELPSGASLELWRRTLSESTQMQGATKGTWSEGQKWTVEKSGGSALYWDVEDERLGGLVIKQSESLSDLDSWWADRFGK